MEKTVFLYHYLPALCCLHVLGPALVEHMHTHLLRYAYTHSFYLSLLHTVRLFPITNEASSHLNSTHSVMMDSNPGQRRCDYINHKSSCLLSTSERMMSSCFCSNLALKVSALHCVWLTELAATAADANCGHGFISLSCNTMKTTRLCQRWLSIHLYDLKPVFSLNYHATQVFIKLKITPMFLSNSASLRRVSCVCVWSALLLVFLSYRTFSPLTYGIPELSANQLQRLKWKESWDILFRRH